MIRKPEFDIMKGILIVLVVIGHTSIRLPYIDLFWFHMPTFFMITGYLSQRWVPFNDTAYLRHKAFQLLVPYLSYSIVLFLFIGYSPLWKYMLKVFLGGTLNITPFSYPFWYVNTLLVALVAFGLIKQLTQSLQLLLIASLYLIVHLMTYWDFHPPVPWGIDNAMGALVFIYIGDKFKVYKTQKWHYSLLCAPVLFTFINKLGGVNYRINMASIEYNHLILDLLVPCIFAFAIYLLCMYLKKWKYITYFFSVLGHSSLTIYFTHAALLYVLAPLIGQPIAVACCLIAGALFQHIFTRFNITRTLFLGNMK